MTAQHGDIASGPGWELRCGDWRQVLADVRCDALITDPPYSARTHKGHDSQVNTNGHRRRLNYNMLTEGQALRLGEDQSAMTTGWQVYFTDHVLHQRFADGMAASGRYVFAPLPWVAHGSRVRMAGDGPSCWVCWLVVSRPRNRVFAKWGTLPGAYLHGAENHGTLRQRAQQQRMVGGKPLKLMCAIVRDYSRPGDLVCDPFAGGATTLLAAVIEGRKAIGAELDPETFDKAVARLRRGYTPSMFTGPAQKHVQEPLF